MSKRFLVTGAGFSNTGAQALMFATVSELKRRFPECSVTVANSSLLPKKYENNITFNYIMTGSSEYYVLAPWTERINLIARNIARKLLGKNTAGLDTISNEVKNADAIIDISGFALGDQWSDSNCLSYLARIELAKANNIPIFIMPQSIGPFNFKGKNKEFILKKTEELLKYPKIIFTRETQGYDLLTGKYHLNNIYKSVDIVLQSKEDTAELTINNKLVSQDPLIDVKDAVAIIPNIHCYSYSPEKTIQIYKEIIDYLLNKGEKVYLIRHSEADAKVCSAIKNYFADDKDVVLCNKAMNCFEFFQAISHFKYAIASRYHSIVHAYKNGVPCIAIGWATKYVELLDLFHQGMFVNDIRTMENAAEIFKQIDNLETNVSNESGIILNIIKELQNNNCFNLVEQYMNGASGNV